MKVVHSRPDDRGALPRTIRRALDACVSPTRVTRGSRHLKIYVGARMVTVAAAHAGSHKDGDSSSCCRDIVASIRREDRRLQALAPTTPACGR